MDYLPIDILFIVRAFVGYLYIIDELRDNINKTTQYDEVIKLVADKVPIIIGIPSLLKFFLTDSAFAKLYYSFRIGGVRPYYYKKNNGMIFACELIFNNINIQQSSKRIDMILLWNKSLPWIEPKELWNSLSIKPIESWNCLLPCIKCKNDFNTKPFEYENFKQISFTDYLSKNTTEDKLVISSNQNKLLTFFNKKKIYQKSYVKVFEKRRKHFRKNR